MYDDIIWNNLSLSAALTMEIKVPLSATGISIDSRKSQHGDIFIGISGENCNGGIFADEAIERGASFAIVDNDAKSHIKNLDKIIVVEDTLSALNRMAEHKRSIISAKVVGITGSVGKTSTKEMAKIALQEDKFDVFANAGNFNGNYGMPLSLASMPDNFDCCILEIGMSEKGEIEKLTKLARPDVAIITEVGPAHLEFFDSVEKIADAKAEIFLGMKRDNGVAVLNADNKYYDRLKKHAAASGLKVISFGSANFCDLQLISTSIERAFTNIEVMCHGKKLQYKISTIGDHFVMNSLGMLGAALALGRDISNVVSNMHKFSPIKGRGEVHLVKGDIIVIDESYNANPISMRAAISRLGKHKKSNNRLIAVMGDMRELGAGYIKMHEALLDYIIKCKIDKVFTIGDSMSSLFRILPGNIRGSHYVSSEIAKEDIRKFLMPGDVIMIKGSFSMNMASIVSSIIGYEMISAPKVSAAV
ncbi:UDP-N-acetylmuramoyl-tripeptide--D-alanyl-D-alanine ligase [Candidatus Lariskella endosymbiont of Hedychridium roseum]|uniref:UDP-N-acetylmuramoyl-tripeptide--D-alanyl-D- alanine ligase n=1 Tax=Candidatus Lariskella endosymbiont of Hedychridium roseum TaxID=3077949 RepID=UPI0030D48690